MPPFKIPELVNLMSETQPNVMVYLMGMGGDILNQDEREELLFMGTAVWKAMIDSAGSIPKVTQKKIDEIEEINISTLESLEGKSNSAFQAASEAIIENHNQKDILGFITEVLSELAEDDEAIRADETGLMFIILKTVVEALDKAAN